MNNENKEINNMKTANNKLSNWVWPGWSFIAAAMVMCFGFVTKTVLITYKCFGCC